MYKTAMRHKYVNEDLSALMILESQNIKARPHTIYTDEEIQILWEHKDDFYSRLLLILIYTGMRINELLSIKSENVYLEEKYLVGGLKTAAGINRKIPISNKIMPFLDTKHKYLITISGQKVTYKVASDGTIAFLKSLNLTHTFHDTRHTTATLMERQNISDLHRKLILGHSSTDITDHYTHVSIEQLIEDINKI